MSREMIEVEDWDEVGYEVAIATVDGPARIEIRESDSPVFQGTGDKESEFHPEVTVLDPPRRFLVVDLAIDGRRVTMEVDLGYVGDADEIMRWLSGFEQAPRRLFIVHGEPAASEALRTRVERELKWKASVVDPLFSYDLT